MQKAISLLLAIPAVLFLAAGGLKASNFDTGRAIEVSGREAALSADLGAAKNGASVGWDSPAANTGFLSPPLVPIPEQATQRRPTGNLIVGEPGKKSFSEPENPLTKDGQAKPQKSGNWMWWALGGAAAGAGLGFLLGGPIGAIIGGVAGALLGFFFGP